MDAWPEARCKWGSWAGGELPARLWAGLVLTPNPKIRSGRFFSKTCGFVTQVTMCLPMDEQDPRALLHGHFVLAATFQRRQQDRVGENTSVCKINER